MVCNNSNYSMLRFSEQHVLLMNYCTERHRGAHSKLALPQIKLPRMKRLIFKWWGGVWNIIHEHEILTLLQLSQKPVFPYKINQGDKFVSGLVNLAAVFHSFRRDCGLQKLLPDSELKNTKSSVSLQRKSKHHLSLWCSQQIVLSAL